MAARTGATRNTGNAPVNWSAWRKAPGRGCCPTRYTLNEPIPGVIVEEASIQDNYGEFPDRSADQGEWRQTPMTKEQRHDYLEGNTEPTRGDAP